jgi:hypothetical protein
MRGVMNCLELLPSNYQCLCGSYHETIGAVIDDIGRYVGGLRIAVPTHWRQL